MQKLSWDITWLNILLINLDFKLSTSLQIILNLCNCLCDLCVLKFKTPNFDINNFIKFLFQHSEINFTLEFTLYLFSKTYIVFVTVSKCSYPAHVFIIFTKTSTICILITSGYARRFSIFISNKLSTKHHRNRMVLKWMEYTRLNLIPLL